MAWKMFGEGEQHKSYFGDGLILFIYSFILERVSLDKKCISFCG